MASIYKRLSSNNTVGVGPTSNVNVISTVLPPNASTATNQSTQITALNSIDSELVNANLNLISIDSHVDSVEGILNSIDSKLTSPLAVTGPLTDVQLRATPVPVSGSFSVTGVSTLVEQQAQTTVLNSIDNKLTSPVTVQATNLDVRDLAYATDKVDASGSSVSVSNFPATQAISAVSLPLPTGASTSALQTSGNASLASIDSKLTSPLSVNANITNSSIAVTGPLTDVQLRAAAVPVSVSGTIPVSGTVTANIGTTGGLALDTSVNSLLKPADTLAAVTTVGSVTSITNPVAVTGTFFQATQPVSIASTVAVSGPLTDVQLRATPVPVSGSITTSPDVNLHDGAGNAVTSSAAGSVRPLDVQLHNSSGNPFGTNASPLRIDPTGTTTQPVSAASLPLPSGAATETTLSALNTKVPANLTVTSTRLLVDGSGVTQPVSGTVAVSSLPSIPAGSNAIGSVSVSNFPATQPVSGTVTANIGTTNGLALDATLTGGNAVNQLKSGAKGTSAAALITSTASGVNHQPIDVAIYDASGNQITSFGGGTQYADGAARGTATGTLAMGDDGTNIQSLSVDTTGKLNLNNISGAISLPTGASTSALQTTGNASLASIDSKLTSPLTVTGPLTDAQLRATPVPVSGTFSSSVLPNLVVTGTITALSGFVQISTDGYSTISLDVLGTFVASWTVYGTNDGTNLFALTINGGAATNLGTGASVPRSGVIVGCGGYSSVVVLATAYTSGTLNVRLQASAGAPPAVRVYSDTVSPLIVGASSLPLPSGASTSALQTTGNASLASIDAKLTNPLPVSGTFTSAPASAFAVDLMTSVSGDVTIDVSGYNTLTFQASGTWTGNVSYFGSTDGSTFDTLYAMDLIAADGNIQTLLSSGQIGLFQMNVSGFKFVRFVNAVASGTLQLSSGLSATEGIVNGVAATLFTNSNTRDGVGNAIQSITSNTGKYNLGVAQSATDFILSTGNSTTTQLAGSGLFTGTIETVFNQQAASILLTSDKAGTLTINQYIDAAGTRKTSAWTYSIQANVPFSRSFTVNGNYFNLSFLNSGGAATTTLNINTAYGTLPVSSNLGNSTVSLDEINGNAFTSVTKGVQATNNLPVQQIKDSGRVIKTFYATFTAATTEALVTLTPNTGGLAGSTGTSFAVTAGKTLRIQSIAVTTRNAGAAGQGVVCQLRIRDTGAVATTSPIAGTVAAGTKLATANVTDGCTLDFPDGLELSGTQQLGVTQVGSNTANNTVVVTGYEY